MVTRRHGQARRPHDGGRHEFRPRQAGMKIDRITLYHVSLPLVRPFVTSFGAIHARDTLVIELQAEGLTGWGTSPFLPLPLYSPEFLSAGKILLAQHILPAVAGKLLDGPGDVLKAFTGIRGNRQSKAGVETAAWDLFAKVNRLPLYKYLGATRNTVETGIGIGIKDEQQLITDIAQAAADGYKRVKIKIRPGNDVEPVKAVRRHWPDLPLMVDANSAYSLADVETFKELDRYGLMMIEQPLADDDLVDHAALQRQLATPICLDESLLSAEHVRKAVELGSCRIVNLKPGRVGGLVESLKILAACKSHGLAAWIGGQLESGIGKAMLAHLATHDAVTLPGDLVPGSTYLRQDIAAAPAPADGVITLADLPGLGVEINRAVLEKHLQDKIVIEP